MDEPEEVKYHSRLKHKFIEIYFNFYLENVAGNATRQGKFPPSLAIYDLYAAKGWCHCKDCEILGFKEDFWEGSALLAAKCIGNYPNGTKLFLNSYNYDPKENELQLKSLKESLINYFSKYPGLEEKTTITSLPIEESISRAEIEFNPDFPSIWILDPYEPKQLPWHIIESIGKKRGKKRKNDDKLERRPELIINFMSSYLQRFSETQPKIASIALGIPESEWKLKFKRHIDQGLNVREAFLRLYFDRLKELYGRAPVFYLVRDISNRAIIYAMLLCSSSDAGHFLMQKHGLPKLKQYEIEEWRKNAKKILISRENPDQKFIDDFF